MVDGGSPGPHRSGRLQEAGSSSRLRPGLVRGARLPCSAARERHRGSGRHEGRRHRDALEHPHVDGNPRKPPTAPTSRVTARFLSIDANGNVVARKAGVVRVGVTARSADVVVSSSVQVTVDDPNRVRIYVSEDAYTDSVNSSTNYGSSWSLRVKGALATTAGAGVVFEVRFVGVGGEVGDVGGVVDEFGDSGGGDGSCGDAGGCSSGDGVVVGGFGDVGESSGVVGDLLGSFLSQRTQSVNTTDLTGFVKSFASSGAGVLSLGLTQDDAGKERVVGECVVEGIGGSGVHRCPPSLR